MTGYPRRLFSTCLTAVVASCSGQSQPANPAEPVPLQPVPVQQDPAGSAASVSGFTYGVVTSLADAPSEPNALLRPTITTKATLRNDRSDTAVVQFGACNVSLVAHRTADRQGTPVWRSSASQPWEGTYGRGCILPLYERRLAPDAELSLGAYSSRVIEILGDSLPDARYYFTATLSVSTAPTGMSLPAGDFELALARPALPDSLTHDLVTYKANSAVGASSVRATVTATLTHAGGSLVDYPRECTVTLVAYRSRERRDAAPRSGAPDWRQTRSCSTEWQQRSLYRGQSISFETTALARDVLGGGMPEGTYHFAVIVHTRTRNVWLSAGAGPLRR